MDKALLEKFLKLMASDNDSDAVMGLRGAQNLCQAQGLRLEDALRYAADHAEQWRPAAPAAGPASAGVAARPAVNISGMPECRAPRAGMLEFVLPGKEGGASCALPGEAAKSAEAIARALKDVIVAAVINKSRFKLKLQDVKNNRGEVLETVLQAEYERQGMIPVRVWANTRGEAGALATVLRKAIAQSLPDLAG